MSATDGILILMFLLGTVLAGMILADLKREHRIPAAILMFVGLGVLFAVGGMLLSPD